MVLLACQSPHHQQEKQKQAKKEASFLRALPYSFVSVFTSRVMKNLFISSKKYPLLGTQSFMRFYTANTMKATFYYPRQTKGHW